MTTFEKRPFYPDDAEIRTRLTLPYIANRKLNAADQLGCCYEDHGRKQAAFHTASQATRFHMYREGDWFHLLGHSDYDRGGVFPDELEAYEDGFHITLGLGSVSLSTQCEFDPIPVSPSQLVAVKNIIWGATPADLLHRTQPSCREGLIAPAGYHQLYDAFLESAERAYDEHHYKGTDEEPYWCYDDENDLDEHLFVNSTEKVYIGMAQTPSHLVDITPEEERVMLLQLVSSHPITLLSAQGVVIQEKYIDCFVDADSELVSARVTDTSEDPLVLSQKSIGHLVSLLRDAVPQPITD